MSKQKQPPTPSQIVIRQFAERLAGEILTVHATNGPVQCDRAAMKLKTSLGEEIDMGGRNKVSIANTIEDALLNW